MKIFIKIKSISTILKSEWKLIKNYPERKSNVKPFIDLYNFDGIKFPTIISNTYTLFERENPEIYLVVLYVNVNIKPFIEKGSYT